MADLQEPLDEPRRAPRPERVRSGRREAKWQRDMETLRQWRLKRGEDPGDPEEIDLGSVGR
jgi:hypothetical protein